MTDAQGDVLARMRGDWDRRAAEDARFYIASGAAGSDEEFRESGRRDVEDAVLDGIRLSPSARVLEVGCGIGRLLVPLASRVEQVYGVDISPAMIERAKAFTSEARNVATWVTEGDLAPVADASLDFVFSYIVFQHIPAREAVRRYVEEAARVLKPGGLFRCQVDGRWKRTAAGAATTYDGVKFSPAEVRALMAGTGLEAVDEWGAETHYHWVTARRAGEERAGASFRTRAWDREALEQAVARCGSRDPAADAGRVVSGAASLRLALQGGEAGISLGSHADFVRDAWERVFGTRAEAAPLEALVRLLEARVEFREDVVDILLATTHARELFRPRPPAPPPPARVVELLARHGLAARAKPGEAESFGGEIDVARAILAGGARRDEDFVRDAYRGILGREPDPEGAAWYEGRIGSGQLSRGALVRELLWSEELRRD